MFVVATANDVTQLPPEFLRKGRFDEMFFVDLPDPRERAAIWDIVIAKYGRKPADFDTVVLARACEQFTGAEIEAVFVDALHEAFAKGREPAPARHRRVDHPHRALGPTDGRPDRRAAPLGARPGPAGRGRNPPKRAATAARSRRGEQLSSRHVMPARCQQ